MLRNWRSIKHTVILAMALSFVACAHSKQVPSERKQTVYTVSKGDDSLVSRFAPLLSARGYQDEQNRIGMPGVKYNAKGEEEIYIDESSPAIYWMTRKFTTSKGRYTNLIYRIHFPEIPLSLIPFHLTAGKNVGLLFIVTLNEQGRPILFTTSGTCGCYAVTIPTANLDKDAYPMEWKSEKPLHVYGETLPQLLDFGSVENPRLMVSLRPDVHRVMDLKVVDELEVTDSRLKNVVSATLLPMASLEKIPAGMGRTTSLYYQNWPYEGLVKGSFKCWETLFMSLISLDFFVGTDKIYGNSETTGTHFYTSLKPWNRKASDMWHFERFLTFNGWHL